jgi:hypothetical protein
MKFTFERITRERAEVEAADEETALDVLQAYLEAGCSNVSRDDPACLGRVEEFDENYSVSSWSAI